MKTLFVFEANVRAGRLDEAKYRPTYESLWKDYAKYAPDVIVYLHVSNEHAVSGAFEVSIATVPVQNETETGGPGDDSLQGNSGNHLLTGDAGNDTLEGAAGNDRLLGGDGSDLLDGGTGRDTMTGGGGDDTYRVDDAGDRVIEQPDGGTDTVISTLERYTLSGNVENLQLGGVNPISGRGNVLANTLTGNAGVNTLDGREGDDTLLGGGYDDRQLGGAGNDVLIGGSGDDNYVVDAGDSVEEAYPSIIVAFNLSPETLADPGQRGFLPRVLEPLLVLRKETKARKATDPSAAGIDSLLKWMLVTCFGYTGFKNAKFGRIEVHEKITGIAREILLRTKDIAEEMGFSVLCTASWTASGSRVSLPPG